MTWFIGDMEIPVMNDGLLSITGVTENDASPEGINYYCAANNTLDIPGQGNYPAVLRSRDINVSHFCK